VREAREALPDRLRRDIENDKGKLMRTPTELFFLKVYISRTGSVEQHQKKKPSYTKSGIIVGKS